MKALGELIGLSVFMDPMDVHMSDGRAIEGSGRSQTFGCAPSADRTAPGSAGASQRAPTRSAHTGTNR